MILNYDTKLSLSYRLRKPEIFFKEPVGTIKTLKQQIDQLTTKPSTPNGRVNLDCVLIKAF
jgi:hypothetical protein